jgi:hypothetical protein
LVLTDKLFVDRFLQRAEEVLEVALTAEDGAAEGLILFDNAGGMRMLDPAGWSLNGLIREFGAREIYRIERRNGAVRVEGWSANQQCLLQRKSARQRLTECYPSTLQRVPRLTV